MTLQEQADKLGISKQAVWLKTPARLAYKKAYQKAYQKAYKKTDKYKAYQKAYQKTDKYKAYQKQYNKHYYLTVTKPKIEQAKKAKGD